MFWKLLLFGKAYNNGTIFWHTKTYYFGATIKLWSKPLTQGDAFQDYSKFWNLFSWLKENWVRLLGWRIFLQKIMYKQTLHHATGAFVVRRVLCLIGQLFTIYCVTQLM